ncbi:nad-dependent protein deacetylase sirtuin-2 [Anaeramoeba flamelloides]|uniref:Nad-dependent protein deacetylase sirtuin-2 n=1 Tax=Anaeramoeba flamelloides TaxID=1746091 RepID=A0ABQ8XIP3_9EUKA|nr:nad-dependent protein deacetylase sirtuin-2 [Anaeramoeba flamelloides]
MSDPNACEDKTKIGFSIETQIRNKDTFFQKRYECDPKSFVNTGTLIIERETGFFQNTNTKTEIKLKDNTSHQTIQENEKQKEKVSQNNQEESLSKREDKNKNKNKNKNDNIIEDENENENKVILIKNETLPLNHPIILQFLTQFQNEILNFKLHRKELQKLSKNPPSPLSFEDICNKLKNNEFKNVVVMCGAGISVAAGIPDFRSPNGLYKQLDGYQLPYPEAIFDIRYFKKNPFPFFKLSKKLFPGNFVPTKTHYFFKLLQKKGILRRIFTQNIDTLERVAGISDQYLVEAHGSFGKATCVKCQKKYGPNYIKPIIFRDQIPKCVNCDGIVKPDIVFFGESVPKRFRNLKNIDFPKADLLLIIGTSLVVQPFCSLIEDVSPSCPRLLINRETVRKFSSEFNIFTQIFGGEGGGGFKFDLEDNYRDIKWIGECDNGIQKMIDNCGWNQEFDELLKERDILLKKQKNGEGGGIKMHKCDIKEKD